MWGKLKSFIIAITVAITITGLIVLAPVIGFIVTSIGGTLLTGAFIYAVIEDDRKSKALTKSDKKP